MEDHMIEMIPRIFPFPKYRALAILMLFTHIAGVAVGCTLWGAAGNRVRDGGVLVAKNRDWSPDHVQYLKMVHPRQGYRFFGLFSDGNEFPGLKAGVNEYGLVVMSATASTIPLKERLQLPRQEKLLQTLLTSCRSIDEALAKKRLFRGPRFLLLADHHGIATVEIAPSGRFLVERKDHGVLFHTNHFKNPELQEFNRVSRTTSLVRNETIGRLLHEHNAPLEMHHFINMSQDRSQGPDNSIWRTGDKLSSKTISTWIVSMVPGETPRVYVRLTNPGEKEEYLHFLLPEVFSRPPGRFSWPTLAKSGTQKNHRRNDESNRF